MTPEQRADQATQEIFEVNNLHIEWGDNTEAKVKTLVLRHIAAALAEQEAEQWIDVREKLPKKRGWYLATRGTTCVGGAHVWHAWFTDEEFRDSQMTHWRALPAPPAKGEK